MSEDIKFVSGGCTCDASREMSNEEKDNVCTVMGKFMEVMSRTSYPVKRNKYAQPRVGASS